MNPTLESELTAGLRDAAAGLHTERDLFASAMADHRRRTMRMRAAAVGGVAVAAALVVGGVAGGVIGGTTPIAAPARSPELLNAAYVTRQTHDALEADLIRHATQRITGWPTDGQIIEEWYDPRTGDSLTHQSGGGLDVRDTGYNRLKSGDFLELDRTTHTWWGQHNYVAGSVPTGHAAPPQTAAEIRATLQNGKGVKVVGREQVNGHATVHVRMVLKKVPGQVAHSIVGEPTYDLWVDGKTFLPVRSLLTVWVPANTKFWPDGKAETTERNDYDWLPRNPVSLTKLRLSVPPGYTFRPPYLLIQVDPSTGATSSPSEAAPSPVPSR